MNIPSMIPLLFTNHISFHLKLCKVNCVVTIKHCIIFDILLFFGTSIDICVQALMCFLPLIAIFWPMDGHFVVLNNKMSTLGPKMATHPKKHQRLHKSVYTCTKKKQQSVKNGFFSCRIGLRGGPHSLAPTRHSRQAHARAEWRAQKVQTA